MTPFKRLTETQGREPWLDAAAQQVQAGDPWALVTDEQARRIGARALAHVRERSRQKSSRTLVIVFAVVASSAALAAAGRYVVGARSPVEVPAPSPAHVVEPSLPPSVTIEPPPSVVVEPPVVSAPPAPARPRAVLRPALAPRAELPPSAAPSPLEAEAALLLKALHQLRVEGNADAALKTLDAHDSQFPSGAMSDEAAAARAEAQAMKSGRSP